MKKIIIIIGVILIVAAGGWYFLLSGTSDNKDTYTFTDITRGDLETVITSSGTIEAVSTVDVGTQVSGIINRLYVDFNDNVRQGQLLAFLDTTFLAASVRDQRAGLSRAQAQYDEAVSKFERDKKLFEKDFISELDYIISKTAVQTAKASLQSAESSLDRAITNLKYAFIRSPINGTVIHRNVEQGQTVAASLSAPVLFILAEDLSNMQILAQVDESDIGQIKEGQSVRFDVQAHSDKKFSGLVRQIRLQPTTVQNVVNYTVVVDAENKDHLLLPGMTATVDFVIEHKEDVLLVSNAALRFKPSDEMMEEYRKNMEARMASIPDSVRQRFRGRNQGENSGDAMQGMFSRSGDQGRSSNFAQLWTRDENGKLDMLRVITGSTDGKMTEIVRGRNIEEGMKVISGIAVTEEVKTNSQVPMRGFGRGPF